MALEPSRRPISVLAFWRPDGLTPQIGTCRRDGSNLRLMIGRRSRWQAPDGTHIQVTGAARLIVFELAAQLLGVVRPVMLIRGTCLRAAPILPLFLSMAAGMASGAWWGPGKYNGVVVFDRWDACYLYSGVSLMEVSEKAKESLRAFDGKAVLVEAQEVRQQMNPGNGLITKLRVLGPAVETTAAHFGGPPVLDGLSLRAMPSFRPNDADELIIELRNNGDSRRAIDTNDLGLTLLAKKQGGECLDPADGPSYPAITSSNVTLLYQNPAGASCIVRGKGRVFRLWLAPGVAISQRFELEPGQGIEVPLRLEISPGEYEFLAGYGGGALAARALASNRFGFDVDEAGKAHLTKGATVVNDARPPRRVGTVCGRVTLEDGSPAGEARVFVWPFPVGSEKPRAAATAIADSDGRFRMGSVLEGKYALSAMLSSSDGVFIGALGGRRALDASPLAVPDSSGACTLSVTLSRQPGYTVRGKTQAGAPSATARTVRMIMTRGDAYPFESTAAVHANGQYEFRNLPPGSYQFFAGSTGSGFSVNGDIEDVHIEIRWPDREPASIGGSAMPPAFNEEMTVLELESLGQAEVAYAKAYGNGFSRNLDALGRPPEWCADTADHAGLLSKIGTPFLAQEDSAHFTESGYRFTYIAEGPDASGKITRYTVSARPSQLGKTGKRSFLLDEGGIIHVTGANRLATRNDPEQKDW